jgi:hypothetical protein
MSAIQNLLTVAKQYGEAKKIGVSTVSWRAFGDTKKISAIQSGADIQMRRFEKAMQWFSDNWPEGAQWPEGVERPEPAKNGEPAQ